MNARARIAKMKYTTFNKAGDFILTLHPTTTGSREGILEGSLTTAIILLLMIPDATPWLQQNRGGGAGPFALPLPCHPTRETNPHATLDLINSCRKSGGATRRGTWAGSGEVRRTCLWAR